MEAQEREALDAYSSVVTRVAEHLLPRVVQLKVGRQASAGGWRQTGTGSGVVITPDGYLLTAAHVVEGADRGIALFADGSERPARRSSAAILSQTLPPPGSTRATTSTPRNSAMPTACALVNWS